jgi:galactoside O-acetyltransferase
MQSEKKLQMVFIPKRYGDIMVQMTSEESKKRMQEGRLYLPEDEEIMHQQMLCLEKQYEYNLTRPSESEKREALLKEMFAEIGEGCYIEPPLHANWAGAHVHFGDNVYANFNLTLVDDTDIYVGDKVMFGPNVTVATAGHPIDPELRYQAMQYNIPVHIGNNVWIGANAVVLPGVTIGDNSVIGAGSVVTKDIPPNVVAVGNPCRVLREISDHDKKYYYKNREIDV